jgi:hypothetical protein
MTDPRFSGVEPLRSRLRATVATLDREISNLTRSGADGRDPFRALRASFDDLVGQLALGPEPSVRECPVCKGIGMRDATRCLYCWSSLTPPTSPAPHPVSILRAP